MIYAFKTKDCPTHEGAKDGDHFWRLTFALRDGATLHVDVGPDQMGYFREFLQHEERDDLAAAERRVFELTAMLRECWQTLGKAQKTCPPVLYPVVQELVGRVATVLKGVA